MMSTLESGKGRNFTFLLNHSAIGSFPLSHKQHLKGDSSNACVLQGRYAYVLVTNQIVKDQCNFRPAGHLLTSYPMQSIFFHLALMLT